VTYEGVRLKFLKLKRKLFAKREKRKLIKNDFTIISNNCWGGMVYESYDLIKQSPTVGLFMIASDYIKFLSKLDEYISAELTFISPRDSRWKEIPQVSCDKRFGKYPVGLLELENESIELFFLHYRNEKEAFDKWNRRCKRINKNAILVKFNDQNGCTEQDIEDFYKLNYENKMFFTVKEWNNSHIWKKGIKYYYFIKQAGFKDFILASYEPFGSNKYFDLANIINKL